MWNSGIHRNSCNIIKYGNSYPLAPQKIKILQRIQILKHYKNCIVILDVQCFIPIKLCKTSGSPHLFKITGTLNSEDIRLNKNYLWDTLEIKWNKIKLSFNSNEIDLPQLVMIKMQDKIGVRRMMSKEIQNFHIMIRQGITWYNLEAEIETV